MQDSTINTTGITLSSLEKRHWVFLEKVAQLPENQQRHLETIVDGLGEGKTKTQRMAAKNTVMTILGITPQDLQWIKQFNKLTQDQQEDLKNFVQGQLHPDHDLENLAPAPTSSLTGNQYPAQQPPANSTQYSASASEEDEGTLSQIIQDAVCEAEPSSSLSTAEEQAPSQKLVVAQPDEASTPESMESSLATETLIEVTASDAEVLDSSAPDEHQELEAAAESSSIMEADVEPTVANQQVLDDIPMEAEAQDESPEAVMEGIADSLEKLAHTIGEEEEEVEEGEVNTEAPTEDVEVIETEPIEDAKDVVLQVSVMGKNLVVSPTQPVENLQPELEHRLGMPFRFLFGLYKSVNPIQKDENLNVELEKLERNGLIVGHLRYPVQIQEKL